VWLAVAVLAGVALRLPAMRAGFPYFTYVDEGHVLHPVGELLRDGYWDPAKNNYPALPVYAIAGAAWLGERVTAGGSALAAGDAQRGFFYDVVEPPLLLVGRGASLLASAAIVLLAGLLASRLAGPVAAVVAAVAAALLPALVARGALVLVDLYATVFVLAAAWLAAGATRPGQWARLAAAGACCGLAAVSKYPAGLAGLALVASVLLAPWPLAARLRGIAVAAAAGLAAAVSAMPALVTRTGAVVERMRWQAEMYRTLRSPTSYWQQAFVRAEWDLPMEAAELGIVFTAWASTGAVLLARDRETRRFVIGAAVFTATLLAAHLGYPFQAFRNLLPLAGLACAAVGVAAALLARRLAQPRRVGLLAVTLLALLFGPADLRWAGEQSALRDSRLQAVDWVEARRRDGDSVLVQGELAVLPSELARLGAPTTAVPWAATRARALRGEPRFLLLGDLVDQAGVSVVPVADRRALRRRYRQRAVFGESIVSAQRWSWRGNRQRITVWERRLYRSGLPAGDGYTAAARASPRRWARTRRRGSSRGCPRTRRGRWRPSSRRGGP
jgi:hypothetical protein